MYMQKSLIALLLFVLIVVLASCAARETERGYGFAEKQEVAVAVEQTLLINEFSPKSELKNESGKTADWIELFNASDAAIKIDAETWSLSDDLTDPEKYLLPDTLIPAHGFLLIWCDHAPGKLHAGFKLSGDGETVYLFHEGQLVDEISYEEDIKKNQSFARVADGSADWEKIKSPTPGNSNDSLEHYAEALQ